MGHPAGQLVPRFPPGGRDRIRLGSSKPMDNLSKQERSERMSRIKGVDTGPEMAVRRLVHRMGFRYRLHARDLPGAPDLVFPRLGKIIFVHGCFWHQHPGCGRQPKSRLSFWTKKLFQNRERDLRNQRRLRYLGWRILIVWECQLKRATLSARLPRFLES
jgi:DNA mismatch endonuclease (patch repair protein)